MRLQPHNISRLYARMRRGPVVIGDILYAKGGSFGPRIQQDYQLVVIHRGSLTLHLNKETLTIAENHGILLSPGTREHFFFAIDGETRHSWMAISPKAVEANLQKNFLSARGPAPFLGRMATLLDLARTEFVPAALDSSLDIGFYTSLTLAVMCDFASAVARQGQHIKQLDETAFWRMDRFIAEACTQQVALNDIARAVGISRQHLLKLCRAAGRPTPMKQLYTKRLEVAADLLVHSGFSIAEIAEQCGFANQFHFSRKFKQSLGSSPLAFRTRLWKKPP